MRVATFKFNIETLDLMTDLGEIHLLILISALFIIPKLLERANIPSPISCLIIGIVLATSIPLLAGDKTIGILATLGICSLFMFAGLEVDFEEISKYGKLIIVHLVIFLLLLVGCVWLVRSFTELGLRDATLFSLALITPSAGFILESLDYSKLSTDQKFWIKSKAIATEIAAIVLMFLLLQSETPTHLAIGSFLLIALVVALPFLLLFFAKIILPYAPGSELSFFVILAVVVGNITKSIGAYYLVGAFIVGIAIRSLHLRFAKMEFEKALSAIKLFSSFFIPFYFFKAGTNIQWNILSFEAFGIAIGLIVIVLPVRLGSMVLSRRLLHFENLKISGPISLSLIPTLIFGLVIADILYTRYALPNSLFGALVIYTLVVSIAPRLLKKWVEQRQEQVEPINAIK